TPPRLFGGNPALCDFAAQLSDPIRGEFDEQARAIPARDVLAENDFAVGPINLTDCPGAVGLVPLLHEAEGVGVEASGAVHVVHEEDGTRVPLVNEIARDCASG